MVEFVFGEQRNFIIFVFNSGRSELKNTKY